MNAARALFPGAMGPEGFISCFDQLIDENILRRRLIGRESYVYISMDMEGYTPEAIGKRCRAAVKILQAVAEQNGYFSGTFPAEPVE